jgi:nitrate reductase gamma subunit
MSLLDFARGPALHWSLIIMLVGILWRLVGALFLVRPRTLSKPRSTNLVWGGVRTVLTRSWLPTTLGKRVMVQQITGYVMHVGLFIVILLFVPHIELIRGLTGLSWPGVPNEVVTVSAALTLGVMIFLLIRRLTDPVLKKISTLDDYVSWLVTALPLATGIMAFAHLALHILSAELLLIWLPFGKLMHMFLFIPSRIQEGVKFERRGVQA